jgi:thioredoxin reductase (NADPH)
MMAEEEKQEREEVAFPTLNEEQIDLLASHAETIHCQEGEILIAEGETDFPFFLVKHGRVRIIEHSQGEENEITVHGPGEFTGDIDMLTGRRALFAAVAGSDCTVLKITAEDLRDVLREHSSLGDVLLKAFLMRRTLLLESDFAGVRVIGSRWSADTFRIRDFLAGNHVPYTWLDLEQEEGIDRLLARIGVRPEETPIVLYGENEVLRNPSNETLAEAAGFPTQADEELYDLVVVGGGPAGLAAAVYAASEGLKTLVLEESAPGGQAACSSKIENYLGFPTGLSGAELAERAVIQAEKFGVDILTPGRAAGLAEDGTIKVITLENGEQVRTRTAVIATGASYRRLPLANLEQYEGSSIFYSATAVEARLCSDSEIAVVGGGNSAGQAAVFLAEQARSVYMFVVEESLEAYMSRYLIRRIEQTDNIHVAYQTEITALHGDGQLKKITARNNQTGETEEYEVAAVFIFIGAEPHTEWLKGTLELDDSGFIRTGDALDGFRANGATHPKRRPYLLETSMPGVFAVGDVRSNSVKRVASAVGEGSISVQFIHQVLSH